MKDGIFNIRPGYMTSQKCLEYMGFLVRNMTEVAEIVIDEPLNQYLPSFICHLVEKSYKMR